MLSTRSWPRQIPLLGRRSLSAIGRDKFNSIISQSHREPSKQNGPLAGTTFVAKDNIASGLTTCGSAILSNYTSPFDATAIQLLESAGLTMVGKANLDEFGMGSANVYSYFGTTLNPLYSDNRVAGGSSGGPAAAVAAELADFSLGTDTGGSVRLPASYCGIVGFKPTYGRISRWGVVAYAQSLDTVGILASEVGTVQKVFAVLDQYDEKDPTSLSPTIRKEFGQTKPKQKELVIGIVHELIVDDLLPESIESWTKVLTSLQQAGHKLQLVSIPSIKRLLSAYYALATAEAASNLSRYDGLRYGLSNENVRDSAADLVSENRTAGFGFEVQRRLLLGNYTLSSESGNHYLRATEVRQKLVQEFNLVFSANNHLVVGPLGDCDILICPTATGPAPSVAEYEEKTDKNYLAGFLNDVLTVPASLAGIPSISLPYENGLGIQVMAQHGDDERLLEVSKALGI